MDLEMRFDYPDEGTAKAVLSAISPENGGYVETRLVETSLICTIRGESAGTVRNTADDLLACIKAAEEAVATVSGRRFRTGRFTPRPLCPNGP